MEFKKLIESFKQFLEETVTDIVYHITDLESAAKILETNKFLTSISRGEDMENPSSTKMSKGKQYYFSVARSTMSSYFKEFHSPAVIFVLDGNKLSQRYKGIPVDYNSSLRFKHHSFDEMEDRIVTDKPFIENAKNYIMEVHCFIWGEEFYSHDADFYHDVKKITEDNNIPIFLYIKKKPFLFLNKSKSIPSHKIDSFLVNNSLGWKKVSRYNDPFEKELESLVNIIKNSESENKQNINNEWKERILAAPRGWEQYISSIINNSDMHRHKREIMDFVISYMKKNKLSSYTELGIFLKNKLTGKI
jgi:hypothetical protein